MKSLYRIVLLLSLISAQADLRGQDCNENGLSHHKFETISKILSKANCGNCHSQGSWTIDDYDSFFKIGECDKSIVTRGNAGISTLITVLNGTFSCESAIDFGIHHISATDLKKIESWINIGAPEHCIEPTANVMVAFDNHACTSCHNPNQDLLWTIQENMDIMQPSIIECGVEKVIELYNPELSSLMDVLTSAPCAATTLPKHEKMTSEEVAMIRDWIATGAPSSALALPLDLLNFSIVTENNHPKLNWITAAEVGVEKMEIERRGSDGNFQKIAEVLPSGKEMNYYQFVDKDVSYGSFYYRINILDYDGRHEFSPIEYIDITAKSFVFKVFPNPSPSSNVLDIEWFSKNDIQLSAKMNLMNNNGLVLQNYRIEKGTNKILLPTLPDGVYYLTFVDYYGFTHFERLIIIK